MTLRADIFSSRSDTSSATPTAVADLYCKVKFPTLESKVGEQRQTAFSLLLKNTMGDAVQFLSLQGAVKVERLVTGTRQRQW